MVKATLNLAVSRIFRQNQILVLHGPVLVGKRVLAEQIAKQLRRKILILDLSKSMDRRRIIHPDLFFSAHSKELIFIEAIDCMPSILVDIKNFTSRFKNQPKFILSTDFRFQTVFRFFQVPKKFILQEVFPGSLLSLKFNKSEVIWQHWLKGGFPGFLSAPSNRVMGNRAERILDQIVSADSVPLVGHQLDRNKIRKCLELIAQLNGSILNFQVLARAMGISGPTVLRYIQFLEASFFIRLLPALPGENKKRLAKAPKIYIRDAGILHHLLGIQSLRALSKSTCQTGSWEGYVIEEIAKILPDKYHLYYYRTQHAAEIQLIITKKEKFSAGGEKPAIAVLIQTGSIPVINRALKNCLSDLPTRKNYIVQVNHHEERRGRSTDLPSESLATVNCSLISLAALLHKLSLLR